MPKFSMHAREFKTMKDPNRNPKGHTKYVCYLDTQTIPQELQDWRSTNPRDQKMTTDVAKTIISSLKGNEDFHELNRGILFSVESIDYDSCNEMLTIELTNNDIHGNIDGGHTLQAIFNVQKENELPKSRYVFAEFLVGLNSSVELASARNNSVQVDLKSHEELKKSFDVLKDILEKFSFKDRVAYHMNQYYSEDIRIIDVREIIAILNMFNQELYPIMSNSSHPIQSYISKEVSLKRFLNQGKENREVILQKMKPIMEDIFLLWDVIECEFPEMVQKTKHHYDVKSYSKYKQGDIVGNSTFYQHELKYLVPKGIVYPIVGAFRALVVINSNDGAYSWKRNPLTIWKVLGKRIATIIWNEKEENPEYIGKSRNVWSNLYKEVLLYTLLENE